ncbi:hypothetical protein Barb6_03020 [Bacteroidales bacterium Barb6]|nr:hypothetical protein Barb6_03020 [Bacteroidales bacterium Barb6]
MNSKTASSNVSAMPSIANSLTYCLIIEFFGSVRMLRSVVLSKGSR